ncbi:cysteine sulfinic acid decarboxylase [Anabrus simplex]|uniref:cysteine sulfinic acid decarboxylase n=1 Tax=Anabrus simplex TaxID=316456 RepID=UPI0035A35CFF
MPTAAETASSVSAPPVNAKQDVAAGMAEPLPTRRKMPWFASLPDPATHDAFFREALQILVEKAVFEGTSRSNPVLEWHSPEQMRQLIELDLESQPANHDKLLQLLKDVIKYSVKTGHPHFINQLFSSVDPYGLVGQWLGDALNPSVYTYEVSPVFTLMEETVLKEMRRIVGWLDGAGDGIFCPGGSIANGYAISCARYHRVPDVKRKGLHQLPRLVMFTSEGAHYSIKKMASFMGIGSDNVYLVRTDSRGKMEVAHLEQLVEQALEEGALPFMVSATAGTTVLGAFDPISSISDVCIKHNMWLHVDAAWGGGALISKKYRHLLDGIHRADSVTWNPHKLLTAPQQCSTFLTKHPEVLSASHSASAQYLFQKDKFYDTRYDTGDKHIQCGRRADVLKFWFMWKAKGNTGLEKHVDTVFENAEYFTTQIKNREGFRLLLEPECTNVCFWYVPPSLRGLEDQPDFNERLHKVAPKIKERMMKDGSMMVTYQPLKDLPNFFRLVLQNSGLDHSDMDFFIKEFERLGSDL